MNKIFTLIVISIFFLKEIIFASTQDDTYINTKNIYYDEKKNIVELSENSKININDINILIDKGLIDYDKDMIEVYGNFYLYHDINILSGKDLRGNLKLTNFTAGNVSYIYNNDLKIDSDKAKRSEYIIEFYDNFLTPCDLDGYFNCPTWSFKIDKTRYDLSIDKFMHYDSFLQIADYKIFYLPYFSHYGAKAPRQKGFLMPSIQFTIGGNSGLKTPYYFPVNSNTDVLITPTFTFNDSQEFVKNYEIGTKIQRKDKGGLTDIIINNQKKENDTEIYSSFHINTKQVINKNMLFSANGIFTNSISTTRSNNEDPIKYEDVFIKIEKYNLLQDTNRDYLKNEIITVESFDDTSDISNIPISPILLYHNYYNFNGNNTLESNISYRILNRDKSDILHPSENYIFKLNNFYRHNLYSNGIYNYNKISLLNSFYDYKFENDKSLNRNENTSKIIFSSDFYFNKISTITPRIKLISPLTISNSNQLINEDSKALSFSYMHNYSDNRLFGSDISENTSRIIYGLESGFWISDQDFRINFNQSYDFKKDNNYAKLVNQNSNFSDYSLELNTNFKDIKFKSDIRLDKDNNSKKEMNYKINFNKILNAEIIYNETSKLAFKNLNEDTKSLKFNLTKNLNDNLSIQYMSSLDLKNNFSPYSNTINLNIFDECSSLEISYLNTRFNDNYNTNPEEIISLKFSMDYIGFFGYEQKTNLLFKEAGDFNYGL